MPFFGGTERQKGSRDIPLGSIAVSTSKWAGSNRSQLMPHILIIVHHTIVWQCTCVQDMRIHGVQGPRLPNLGFDFGGSCNEEETPR